MNTNQKGIVILGGIILTALGALGVLLVMARSMNVEAAETQPTSTIATPAKEPVKPPQQSVWHPPVPTHQPVDIKEVLAEYKDNEVRADSTYKNKQVIVTGKVGNISKGILGGAYITVGTGSAFEIPMIQCHLKTGEQNKATRYGKNTKITVRGKITGLFAHVSLSDCEIVE